MRLRDSAPSAERGFTYLGVLVTVALLALTGSATLKLGAVLHRRAAEQALLETGAAFGQALRSYARATPKGQPEAPKSLQDLLRDPRFPGVVRHLRRVYADPMTGVANWGLERDESDGGIVGVYSLSCDKPIKVAGFDARFPGLAGKHSNYREWKFLRPPDPDAAQPGQGSGLISPRDLIAAENEAPSEMKPSLDPSVAQPEPCGKPS